MPRAKTVFGSHEQTAHVWAQRNISHGRSADGRMFWDGNAIYSYGRHFAIASFAKTLKGENCVLINSSSYSVSTSKHQSIVRRALRSDLPSFYVKQPSSNASTNLDLFDAEIRKLLTESGQTKHKGKKARLALEATQVCMRRNEFGAAFVSRYKPLMLGGDVASMAQRYADAEKRKIAMREKGRLAHIEARYQHAEGVLKAERSQWPRIWRAGLPVNKTPMAMLEWIKQNYGVLLRRHGENILTSAGAEFPVHHATRAFPLIAKARGNGWVKNGHKIPLGVFEIDEITPEGDVKAGCHLVKWPEIARMAKRLGLSVRA